MESRRKLRLGIKQNAKLAVEYVCLGNMNEACLNAIVRNQVYDLVREGEFEEAMIDYAIGIMVERN